MNAKYQALILCIFITPLVGCDTSGESRHERHSEALAQSAQPAIAAGASSFQTSISYDKAFDNILAFLQKRDWMIENASKDTGQIVTAFQITGGWRQTGTRVVLALIKDNGVTTIKVSVTEQHRYKALQTEPWDDAKINPSKTSELTQELKASL